MDEVHDEEREAVRIARELSKAISESEEYRNYRACLEEIKKDTELYNKVNHLRRSNFELQNGSEGRLSYEEYAALSEESVTLRQNPAVSGFLDAEVGLGRLVSEVVNIVAESIDFDSEFLN